MKSTYSVTKESLINAPIPLEERIYRPFSHEKVIDLTLEALEGSGFKLDKEEYRACRDNKVAIGKYSIKNVADSEMKVEISWLNSYDKSKKLTWAIGSHVILCMNGMVSADMGSFKKKHRGEIGEYAPKTISEYVKRAGDVFREMQKEREEMKKIELSERDKSLLIGRLFLEEKLITSTQMNIIAREIEIPTFDYGAKGSMWEFYNHLTLSYRDLHPSLYLNHHMDAHKFFVGESGLFVPNSHIPSDISVNQTVLFDEITPV